MYLAGDTVWYQGVENAIEKFSPDVVVVNSAEAAISGFGRIIMGLEDISEVLKAAPSAIVIASHMDNVGHAKLWRKDIRALPRRIIWRGACLFRKTEKYILGDYFKSSSLAVAD